MSFSLMGILWGELLFVDDSSFVLNAEALISSSQNSATSNIEFRFRLPISVVRYSFGIGHESTISDWANREEFGNIRGKEADLDPKSKDGKNAIDKQILWVFPSSFNLSL